MQFGFAALIIVLLLTNSVVLSGSEIDDSSKHPNQKPENPTTDLNTDGFNVGGVEDKIIESADKSIDVFSMLKKSHMEFLKSGFGTLLEITVARKRNRIDQSPPKTYYISKCLVKYDIWNEVYLVGQSPVLSVEDKSPGQFKIDSMGESDFIKSCLFVSSEKMRGAQNDEIIEINFYAKQVGDESGEKIKQWLIAQQSGIMQGLYSHIVSDVDVSLNERFILTPYDERK